MSRSSRTQFILLFPDSDPRTQKPTAYTTIFNSDLGHNLQLILLFPIQESLILKTMNQSPEHIQIILGYLAYQRRNRSNLLKDETNSQMLQFVFAPSPKQVKTRFLRQPLYTILSRIYSP